MANLSPAQIPSPLGRQTVTRGVTPQSTLPGATEATAARRGTAADA